MFHMSCLYAARVSVPLEPTMTQRCRALDSATFRRRLSLKNLQPGGRAAGTEYSSWSEDRKAGQWRQADIAVLMPGYDHSAVHGSRAATHA